MEEEILFSLRKKMERALSWLQEELGTIRTGRATPALIENLSISAYEGTQKLKLKEMATITTEGPRVLVVSPFDPSVIRDLEKGLLTSNLGFTVKVEGNLLRVIVPPLSQERREEFVKLAKAKIEGGRVMVRQARHEAMAALKRQFEAKEISEDEKKRWEKEIQKLTDEFMAEIEVLREKKEKELREI